MEIKLLARNIRLCVEVYVNSEEINGKAKLVLKQIFSKVESIFKDKASKLTLEVMRADTNKKSAKIMNTFEAHILNYLQQETSFHKTMNSLINNINIDYIVEKTVFQKNKTLRKPIQCGEIGIVIVHSSDTKDEADALKYKLLWEYNRTFLSTVGYTISTNSWPDIASQTGNLQELIFKTIFSKIDIVICVIKHKYGTPSYFNNGKRRFESGVEEEIYHALQRNSDKILTMLYICEEPLSVSLADSNAKEKVINLHQILTLLDLYKDEIVFKYYSNSDDLLQKALSDLTRNIKDHFVPIQTSRSKKSVAG